MVDIPAQIKEIEDEMFKTQYNKATEHHFGVLKAKIAKLREKQELNKRKGPATGGFAVKRSGDATVILVGFPSVGKSTLLNAITGAKSATAAYAFTTLTVIPGVLRYKSAKIQILDVPGIIAGAASGMGRGKEVLAVARSADLVLFVLEAGHPEHLERLKKELYDSGIRLNETPPAVKVSRSPRGNISILSTCKQQLSTKTFEDILKQLRLNNVSVVLRELVTIERFIDGVLGGLHYTKSVAIITKSDLISEKELEESKKISGAKLCVSASTMKNIDVLKEILYQELELTPVYLKELGKPPDMKEPLVLRKGSTIRTACGHIHRDVEKLFTYARIWGPSAKFPGQIVKNLDRQLSAGDILEVHSK